MTMHLVASTKLNQSPFPTLAVKILGWLFRPSERRSQARLANIGEFSLHLQRDMGFADGLGTPGRVLDLDPHDRATLELKR
jgi:hypothetical protein